jgi:D-beta-D-heptose 7-phosphate kinase/D-beta-D-heptose 1-phosphate adenosyltransferase
LITDDPQINLDSAIFLCRFWQQRGETIVFTNGCFDVLHGGHVWLFEQARMLGRHLIIAVNSDVYVRRVKGLGRPVQPSSLRRRVVQAVSQAEIVLSLDDNDPRALLQILKPDIYVLGSDYRGYAIPGTEYCGQTVFIERLPGISTTESLRRFNGSAI